MQTDTQKLRVLRARTDHDLLALVQRELERGLTAVQTATTKSSQPYVQAQRAYDTATNLLPRLSDSADRLRIEGQAKELRNQLDQVPTLANVRSYPASFAS